MIRRFLRVMLTVSPTTALSRRLLPGRLLAAPSLPVSALAGAMLAVAALSLPVLSGFVMAQPAEPAAAQPTLPKERLVIVGRDGKQHVFNVEMALTPQQQEVGEMFRKNVPADEGMLFVQPFPHEAEFWMKNTLVPLDMVFINADGKIRTIAEDTTPQSLADVSSRGPVKAILELAGGSTAKLGIRVGDTVKQRIFDNAS